MCIAAPFWFWKKLSHGKKISIVTNLNYLYNPQAAFQNWVYSTGHLVYYFISIQALYYALLNFRLIYRLMSEIKLHHLPPGIFDKNTRLIQLSVTLFFFLCEPCLLNFNLIFVKRNPKSSLSHAMQALIRFKNVQILYS